MPPREVAARTASAARGWIDCARAAAGWTPPVTATDDPPGFTVLPCGRDDFLRRYARLGPEADERLRRSADALSAGRLRVFDITIDSSAGIDWQKDYAADRGGSLRLIPFVDYRDFERVGDCKLVWEVNRHLHWVVLGRAYVVTGEERYAERIVLEFESWRDANPFFRGMNWRSPLELGVRLINWVWAFDLIRGSAAYERVAADVRRLIEQHCWLTARNYSGGSSSNNHLIGEAAGVYVAASYLSSMRSADRWIEESARILEAEIFKQTFDDGCTSEHAFGYQFFVIQFFLVCGLVGQRRGRPFSDRYWDRLKTMMSFVCDVSEAYGSPTLFGDCDDGYVLDLGDAAHDFTALRSILNGLDGCAGAVAESRLWLLGGGAGERAEVSREVVSRCFDSSGYCLLTGTGPAGERLSLWFDCAPLGYGELAAHGHADALSIMLSWGGQEVLVDPGTYDYFTYPQWRSYFRSTRAHNTVEVDGQDQSVMTGPFMWSHRANAELIEWAPSSGGGSVSGEHDGYVRLGDSLMHRRLVELDAPRGQLLIEDRFETAGRHELRQHFHFAPEWSLESMADSVAVLSDGARRLRIHAQNGARILCYEPDRNPGPGHVSRGYHSRVAAVSLAVCASIDGSAMLATRFEFDRERLERRDAHAAR